MVWLISNIVSGFFCQSKRVPMQHTQNVKPKMCPFLPDGYLLAEGNMHKQELGFKNRGRQHRKCILFHEAWLTV
jgi:hypothetical protein